MRLVNRLVAGTALIAAVATTAMVAASHGAPADLAVPVTLPGTSGPNPALEVRFDELFGPRARTVVHATALPLPEWGLPQDQVGLGWGALGLGLLLVVVAGRRRSLPPALVGAGCALVAGAALHDAHVRDAREVMVAEGVDAALPDGEVVHLAGSQGTFRGPMLVATAVYLDATGQMGVVEHDVPALLGATMTLWSGPAQTVITLAETGMGRAAWTRVEGAGPPAILLRWPASDGALYDTWALRDQGPIEDPEGRFSLRYVSAPSPAADGEVVVTGDNTGTLSVQGSNGAPTRALPMEVEVGGLTVQVTEVLPIGSQRVLDPIAGPGSPMAVLQVDRAEGSSTARLLLDNPDSYINTDGLRILLKAGYALATPDAAVQVEVLRDGTQVAAGPLGADGVLRWSDRCLAFGALRASPSGRPQVRLAAFRRPDPWSLWMGLALLVLSPLAALLRRWR